MRSLFSKIVGLRKRELVEPRVFKTENSEAEQYERILTLRLLMKDYTAKNLVTEKVLHTAFEKMQQGTLDKYIKKQFPERKVEKRTTKTLNRIIVEISIY